MLVSVIIPTYNRGYLIHNILDALAIQTYKEFEVVIVNDGSTDDTAKIINDIKINYSFPINLIEQKNSGRAVCRNTGVKYATGELLIFFDDDVRPNPETIFYHVNFHKDNKDVILDGPAFYDQSRIKSDFQRFRMEMEHSWYPNTLTLVKKDKAGLTGANKSMRKTLFYKVGEFNVNLTDSEDFEFAYRAMHKHGIEIFQDRRTWVYHDDYKNFKTYLERRIEANNSSKRLVKLFPEILENYRAKFIFKPDTLKAPFFKFFQTAFWRNFPETNVFLLLPKAIRYKLYKIIITANTLYI